MVWQIIITAYVLYFSSFLQAENDPYITEVLDFKAEKPFKEQQTTSRNKTQSPFAHLPVQPSTLPGTSESATLSIRGFSGERTTILLEDLDLADPAFGLFDPTDLPSILRSVTLETKSHAGLGQTLQFHLPIPTDDWALSQWEMGSFGHQKLEMGQQTTLTTDFHALTGFSFSRSEGNFGYENQGLQQTRQNNDQHRISALSRFYYGKPKRGFSALVFSKFHEGGIAGSLFYPSPHLRLRNIYLGVQLQSQLPIGQALFIPQFTTRLDDRQTKDMDQTWATKAMAHRLQLQAKIPILTTQTQLQATAFGEYAHLLESGLFHAHSQASLGLSHGWQNLFQPFASVELSQGLHSNFSASTTGILQLGISPFSFWQIGFQLAKTRRNPTLAELHAPLGFAKPNPNLQPESLVETEIRSIMEFQPLTFKISAFSGALTEAIVYDLARSQNINAGQIQRLGLESHVTLTPIQWIQLELSQQWLHSHMQLLNASIPKPPLHVQATLTIGNQTTHFAYLHGHYQSAFTNGFTQHIHPDFATFNSGLNLFLTKGLHAHLSVTNLFNSQSIDTMENPIPGRAFWVSLEFSDENI